MYSDMTMCARHGFQCGDIGLCYMDKVYHMSSATLIKNDDLVLATIVDL